MKKITRRMLIATACFGVMVVGYGVAKTASMCSSVSNKFECEAEWAALQAKLDRCKKSCPTKQGWDAYCEGNRLSCEGDCEFLLDEGKTQKDVDACKQKCREMAQKCKASFKSKDQCTQGCVDTNKEEGKAFEERWKVAK